MNKSNTPQSRLTGAVALLISQAIVLVFGYVAHLWIGRHLGPEAYGTYGIVLSLQTIFGLILTLGVPVAISRFVAQDTTHARAILRRGLTLQLGISLIVASLVASFSPLLARILGDNSLTPYIIFVAIVIFFQSFYPVFSQYLSGAHQFNRQALLTSLYATAKLAGALALMYTFHVYGALAGFIVGGIFAGILGWYWTKPHLQPGVSPHSYRAYLSFAGIYVLVLVGLQLLISLDLFMVKALLRSDELTGYYNAAVTLSRIPFTLLQSLAFILLPSVSRLTKPGESHVIAAQFISDTIRYLIALIVPGTLLAATTSQTLITLFYSHAYDPASSILSILIIGLGALAFFQLLVSIVAGAGRPGIALYITIFLCLLSISLGFILIPTFGTIGAAWQTTISGIAGLILLGAYTFRSFHIPLPIKSIINILMASIIAVLPTYLWHTNSITIIPTYLLAGLIYLLILFALQEVKPSDRSRLSRIHPWLKWVAP